MPRERGPLKQTVTGEMRRGQPSQPEQCLSWRVTYKVVRRRGLQLTMRILDWESGGKKDETKCLRPVPGQPSVWETLTGVCGSSQQLREAGPGSFSFCTL